MTRDPSTFRVADDATWGDPLTVGRRFALPEIIKAEWVRAGEPDLVASIAQHPQILRDRSVLLSLALEEYKGRGDGASQADLRGYCERFHRFGSSIQQSILRQLETQRYIDEHPELLDLFGAPVWPEPRQVFGDFLVQEELGRGAIARVFLCRQSEVGNRLVVVKAAHLSSAEAHVLGRLNHSGIIPIHSIGEIPARNLKFICMPFCGRSTLVDVLELAFSAEIPRRGDVILQAARRWLVKHDEFAHPGQAPPQRRTSCGTYIGGVIALGVEIGVALSHAHGQGILHGDIKPSNILLTPEGRPMLMDFNLSVDFTNSVGLRGGTLPYMPPEHLQQLQAGKSASREPEEFDARQDIYSFGALLYELLTGSPPVSMSESKDDPTAAAEQVLGKLRAGIPPLRERNPLVSANLATLVKRCLELDPRDRPASIVEVQRALERELRLAPSVRRRVSASPRKYAAILTTMVIIGGVTGVYWGTRPLRHEVEFARGQQAYAAGEFDGAVEHYTAAASAAPELVPPKFELARAKLAAGEIESSINLFSALAQSSDHAPSMAYLGYCFNLKDAPAPAVEWYEKAIEHKLDSVAVLNNLGATYLISQNRLSTKESITRAETLLQRALKSESYSNVVRLNLLRLELAKANRDRNYVPTSAREHVLQLLDGAASDPVIYSVVRHWRDTMTRRSVQPGNSLPTDLQSLPEAFPNAKSAVTGKEQPATRFYIEPGVQLQRSA